MLKAAIGLAVAAFALTGCGGKERPAAPVDPLATALARAPSGAAVLAVVATDTQRGPAAAVARLGARFPALPLLVGQLGLGDVAALAGNPLVLWSPDGLRPFAALVVHDGDAAEEQLAARVEAGGLRRSGDVFTLPTGQVLARDGTLLLAAPDAASLRAVRARRGGGWTRALVRRRSLGLPAGAAARVLVDARVVLARRAPQLPWVGALDRAALTATATPDGLVVRARASLRPLPDAELPLAPGAASPTPRGSAPLVAAVRDPQPTVRAARAALELLDPSAFRALTAAEGVLGRVGVDLEGDVFGQLAGTATLTSGDGARFTLRSDLADAGRVSGALGRLRTLSKIGGPLAGLVGIDTGGFDVDEDDGRFVVKRDGAFLVAVKVVDGALVASTDEGADLDAAARAPAVAVPADGALRLRLGADALRQQLITRLGLPALAAGALRPLGAPLLNARAERGLLDARLLLPVAP